MPKGLRSTNAAAYGLSGSAVEVPRGAQALFGLKDYDERTRTRKQSRRLLGRPLRGSYKSSQTGRRARQAGQIAALPASQNRRAVIRRLRRLLLLPSGSFRRDTVAGRRTGKAWSQSRRGHRSRGRDEFLGGSGLRAREVVPRRARRFLGGPAQLPDRIGRCDRLYAPVCIRGYACLLYTSRCV